MFSHIILGARDIDLMVRFYAAILGELGFVPVEEEPGGPLGQGWHIPGRRWPQFYVQVPLNGLPATWGNGRRSASPSVRRRLCVTFGKPRYRWEAATKARQGFARTMPLTITALTVVIRRGTSCVLSILRNLTIPSADWHKCFRMGRIARSERKRKRWTIERK